MAETDWTDNPGDPSATDEETLDATEANDVNPEPAEVDAVDQEVQDILSGEQGAEEDAVADAVADEQELAEEMDEEDRLRKQVEETTDDLKRVTAEYANYRRRVERDRVAVVESARADVADKLLPLMDDLQLAESHGDLNGPLKSTYDKLQAVLGGLKVEAFGDEGDEFTPDLHEAVQDTSSGEVKVLGTVLRKGYRLGDRVLRTALVIITDQQ